MGWVFCGWGGLFADGLGFLWTGWAFCGWNERCWISEKCGVEVSDHAHGGQKIGVGDTANRVGSSTVWCSLWLLMAKMRTMSAPSYQYAVFHSLKEFLYPP